MTMTDQMDEFSVWWYGDHSEELQSINSAWHGWYAKESTHAAEVEKLREEIARLTYVEEAYKAEWFAVKTLKNKLEMQYAVFAGDCIIAKEEGFQAGKQAAQDLLKDKP